MKANIENLKKVMGLCAEAHKAEFVDWEEEGQLGVGVDNIPTLDDVQAIFKAFFTCDGRDMVEKSWGYVTLWLPDEQYFRGEVDKTTLEMALPFGWLDRIAA